MTYKGTKEDLTNDVLEILQNEMKCFSEVTLSITKYMDIECRLNGMSCDPNVQRVIVELDSALTFMFPNCSICWHVHGNEEERIYTIWVSNYDVKEGE